MRLFSTSFLAILLIGISPFSMAHFYEKSPPRNLIGRVTQVRGEAVVFNNYSKLIQYLEKGDDLSERVILKTRKKSKVWLELRQGGKLVIGEKSKIMLNSIKGESRLRVTLYEGQALYRAALGEPEVAFHYVGESELYTGRHFLLAMRDGKRKLFAGKGTKVFMVRPAHKAPSPTPGVDADLDEIADIEKAPVKTPEQKAAESFGNAAEDEALAIFGMDDEAAPDKVAEEKGVPEVSAAEAEALAIFGDPTPEIQKKIEEERIELPPRLAIDYGRPEDPLRVDKSLVLRSAAYFNSPPEGSDNDDQSIHGDARLNMATKLNFLEGSLTASGWVDISNRKESYRPLKKTFDFRDDRRPYVAINELFYLENWGDIDFTIGKKVYKLGKGIIFSPSDRISPTDQVVPVDSTPIGNFMINIDYYIGDASWTLIVLPYLIPSKTPPFGSRWSSEIDGRRFKFDNQINGEGLEKLQTMLKFETVLGGWDIFAAVFNGPNQDPVIRNETVVVNGSPDTTLIKEHVLTTAFAGGFSTTFGGMELHGEALMLNSEKGKDDAYTSYMGGFRYTMDVWPTKLGLDQIDMVMEYAQEVIRQKQTAPFYIASSINSRIYQSSLVGTFIFKVSDSFLFNYDYHFDNKNNGSAQFLGVAFSTKRSGEFRARIEMFGGDRASLFGLWDNNDNLSLEYQYTF